MCSGGGGCSDCVVVLLLSQPCLVPRLSEQAQRQLQDSEKFEDILMGASRPTMVVQGYQELYSQGRVEASEAIEDLNLTDNTPLISELLLQTLQVTSMVHHNHIITVITMILYHDHMITMILYTMIT